MQIEKILAYYILGIVMGQIVPYDDYIIEKLNKYTYDDNENKQLILDFGQYSQGRCYKYSRILASMLDEDFSVCEGILTNLEGFGAAYGSDRSFKHAWIETENYVYDTTLIGKYPKKLYYDMFSPTRLITIKKADLKTDDKYREIIQKISLSSVEENHNLRFVDYYRQIKFAFTNEFEFPSYNNSPPIANTFLGASNTALDVTVDELTQFPFYVHSMNRVKNRETLYFDLRFFQALGIRLNPNKLLNTYREFNSHNLRCIFQYTKSTFTENYVRENPSLFLDEQCPLDLAEKFYNCREISYEEYIKYYDFLFQKDIERFPMDKETRLKILIYYLSRNNYSPIQIKEYLMKYTYIDINNPDLLAKAVCKYSFDELLPKTETEKKL